MSDHLVDRKIEAYVALGPTVLADRVLDAALEEAHLRRQRHAFVRLPWRFRVMNSYAKFAAAAVVVIAIGAVGLAMFGTGGSSGVGGPPAVTPSPSPSPTPTPSSSPDVSPSASAPPALTGRFISTIHGISIAYPEGWARKAATEPWTSGVIDFEGKAGDVLYDDTIPAHLFLVLGSQPLGTRTPEQWATEKGAMGGCGSMEPTTVAGRPGTIGTDCNVATVTSGDRGYLILLYTSADDAWLADAYDRDWFNQLLATVQLHPEDAVDTVPSPVT